MSIKIVLFDFDRDVSTDELVAIPRTLMIDTKITLGKKS